MEHLAGAMIHDGRHHLLQLAGFRGGERRRGRFSCMPLDHPRNHRLTLRDGRSGRGHRQRRHRDLTLANRRGREIDLVLRLDRAEIRRETRVVVRADTERAGCRVQFLTTECLGGLGECRVARVGDGVGEGNLARVGVTGVVAERVGIDLVLRHAIDDGVSSQALAEHRQR